MSTHPDVEQLVAPAPPPDVAAHLRSCARCRVDRRVLQGIEADDVGPTHLAPPHVALPSASSLVTTWRSAHASAVFVDSETEVSMPRPAAEALGPYTLDAVLGRGGMAVVYRVADRRTGVQRALKVLRTRDAELGRRLRREGRVQRDLDHPNVVRVVEVIEVEGQPGLVLEYVPGPSLHAVLREQNLPLDVIDRVGAEILAGVAAAHKAGVVHRDLKPGNVLLAPGDDGFVARVTDFGLARGTAVGLDSLHTRTGTFAGTPLYMAPEQLRDASRADARSDVFSLGALLYELVTGLRCFAGHDYVDVVRRVADVRWDPIASVRPGVPSRMVQAVAAALQADPSDRPADASELAKLWAATEPHARWPQALVELAAALHAPDDVPVAPAPLPPNNLLVPDDSYVGRAHVRAHVATLLDHERVVTLTGPGGVGKTRLALEVARDVAHRWPGGVWVCDLTAARSVDGIAAAVGRALGVHLEGDPVQRVGHALATRGPMLVVLDNFEQVVEHAEATVEAWSEAAPLARFLSTSREPLDLFDERVVPLDILDVEEATLLFVARARRAVAGFEVGEHNRASIQQIVAALDGLPLALEIAAARVRQQDLQRLLAHIGRFRGDRHSVLRATLDASWDLLSSDERLALTRMTVFETYVGRDAVVAVLGDVRSAVDALVQRSLVRRVGEGFGLLVTVRSWAAAKRPAERVADDEARHGAWVASIAEADAEPILEDVVAACHRAVARGSVDIAVAAANLAWLVLHRVGPLSRLRPMLDEVLAVPGVGGGVRAQVLYMRAMADLRAGRAEQAEAQFMEALGLARAAGDMGRVCSCLNHLGLVAQHEGDTDRMRAFLSEALEVAREVGEPSREAYLHGALASASLIDGDLVDARRRFLVSLEKHQAIGNDRGVSLVLGDLGTIDAREGDLETAESRVREAIAILQRLGQPIEEAVGWNELSEVFETGGRVDDALAALQRAAELQREAGALGSLAETVRGIGVLCAKSERLERAGEHLEEALGYARAVGSPVTISRVLSDLADVRKRQGSEQLADALAQQSRELLNATRT